MRRMIASAAAWMLAWVCAAGGSEGPTLSRPVEVADRLLAETSTAAEAARRWLRENLSDEAITEYKADATALVTERFDAALAEARRAHEETLGVFVYSPGGLDAAGAWARPVDGAALPPEIVLLIHGLDEGGTIWDDLAPALHAERHAVLRFNYPNDQRIADSTDLLAEALRDLRGRGVRTVDLVGHSMGGLVARDVLTRPEHYAGDARGGESIPAIRRLVMVGTPNTGAPLAPLRGAMEARDQFVRWLESEDKSLSQALGFMVDGDGEAGVDLAPGSAFLTDLNGRTPPRHVAVTCIVGEVGSCGREVFVDALDSAFVRKIIGRERAEAWKQGTNGSFDSVGDGAVPCDSAILGGVEDVVVLKSNHRTLIKSLGPVKAIRNAVGLDTEPPPAIPVILERLRD
jgi:pimeloyl-ACP methyl ester carboxylesterase